MNEFIQSFIEDPSTEEFEPTAFPAANSTSSFDIPLGLRYIHVIVAIYALVLVLGIGIFIIIVSQGIRYTLRKRNTSGYAAIHRQRVSVRDPDIDTLDDSSITYGRHRDDNSDFENLSVNVDREEDPNHNELNVPSSDLHNEHHGEDNFDPPPPYPLVNPNPPSDTVDPNPPSYESISH